MFEDRYCAFVDILGFSDRVEQLEQSCDVEALDRLISCLRFMDDEVSEPAYGADLPVYNLTPTGLKVAELGDPRLTYVSDCLIVSAERNPSGFTALCRKTTKIWLDLLWDGYLCRGAISGGPLVHSDKIIFGTAYSKAYRLEAKAIVPRVIIDKDLSEIYSTYPSEFPRTPPTMERGEDGYLYLRYFPYHFYPPYVPNWTEYLLSARRTIEKGLAHPLESVRKKYEHAKEELNFAIDNYRRFLEPMLAKL
jgi:hypothetical protein